VGRPASLVYIAREKVKGVPHHAKAGNINSCLLKEGPGRGVFMMVLDCDMIVHPDFLLRTLGHFYEPADGSTTAPTKQEELASIPWRLKDKAALLQTPQDFWNVPASDPLVHCARFFYGPMLQGRDGIGAAPCCGTGVIFRRDILVSIGGQEYGSITEDYNTAMTLLSQGFATMYLNERLVFGMVPEDIEGGCSSLTRLPCTHQSFINCQHSNLQWGAGCY
jgi:cellulose synthase (UDP-forming)